MGSGGSRKRRVPSWVWWIAFLALWVVVMGAARDAIGWVTDQAVPNLVATGGYWLSNAVAVAVVAVLGLPALWGQYLRYRRIELAGDPHPPSRRSPTGRRAKPRRGSPLCWPSRDVPQDSA